jgi:hypothetical protein
MTGRLRDYFASSTDSTNPRRQALQGETKE